MNFSLDDRHRSIRRFLMNALGSPPWTIRTERQPVADEQRPVAVVEVVSPAATTWSRTSIPQGDVRRSQAFALTLYPQLGASPAEAGHAARELAELLTNAIGYGLNADDGSRLSAPEALPVYNFAGVPVKGATRAGPAVPYGWMDADDFPVRPVQDPEDPLRWTVVCDLRVTWWQGGRVRPTTELPVRVLDPVQPGTVPPGGTQPTEPWPEPSAPVEQSPPPTDSWTGTGEL